MSCEKENTSKELPSQGIYGDFRTELLSPPTSPLWHYYEYDTVDLAEIGIYHNDFLMQAVVDQDSGILEFDYPICNSQNYYAFKTYFIENFTLYDYEWIDYDTLFSKLNPNYKCSFLDYNISDDFIINKNLIEYTLNDLKNEELITQFERDYLLSVFDIFSDSTSYPINYSNLYEHLNNLPEDSLFMEGLFSKSVISIYEHSYYFWNFELQNYLGESDPNDILQAIVFPWADAAGAVVGWGAAIAYSAEDIEAQNCQNCPYRFYAGASIGSSIASGGVSAGRWIASWFRL